MFDRFLERLEIRFGRYNGIRNLMTCIIASMAVVFVSDLLLANFFGTTISQWLYFDRTLILRGQIWRLFTYVLLPPDYSVLMIFSLLFYYFIGRTLQSTWGNLRFNVFYFTGVALTSIAGMFTGFASNEYLNLSLFLSFALLYPEMVFNLYGIIAVKAKWLALLDLILILPDMLNGTWGMRVGILVSFANIALFFHGRLLKMVADARRRREWKRNWRR